jgi:hypothetical protein
VQRIAQRLRLEDFRLAAELQHLKRRIVDRLDLHR